MVLLMGRYLNDMTREEIACVMEDLKEPSYRAGQICDWLYRKRARRLADMTNLPAGLRDNLSERYDILVLGQTGKSVSAADGTVKYGLALPDGNQIETVFLPHARGATLCISSQVGCGFGCKFCATGQAGFKRDLSPAEIVGQVLFIQDQHEDQAGRTRPFSNIVFMGMGEPLLNYENTLKAVAILIREMGIGARRITISTSGLPEGIMALAREPYELGLAISLNATTDEKRQKIMPVAARTPLVKLMNAARYYHALKGRILTFEYVLIKDVNDSIKDAHELASLTREVPAKINLIALNPFPGCKYERPDRDAVAKFETILRSRGKKVTLRSSLGSDIQAACGQLAVRRKKPAERNT